MAVLNIYNDIQSEQEKAVTRMWGMEPGVSFRDINEFCDTIPAEDKTIDVHIHCNGGDVLEGWAIYDRLRATGKEITTIVDGTAASMATVIMMAAPKERRKAYANAQILVHNPWLDPSWIGNMGMATADDLEKAAAQLKEQQDRILDLYVERCGCDRDEMAALMAEDKFISVERAMELGMVGEVIAPISAKSVNHMSIKDKIINAINSVFGTEEQAPMMAMELATASGDTLRIEREEGAPAVGDVAEPDGEWLMPDNTTIVVENGVITEIRQPEEQVDEAGDGQEGDGTAEEEERHDDNLEQENGRLKERIAELEAQVAELTELLEEARSNARTNEDNKILNMVTMAGGYEKVAASIKSNYTPEKRDPVTSKAEEAVQRNYLKERIEAARNKNIKK
jgi:ATP-dependent Clp protease protease subunit